MDSIVHAALEEVCSQGVNGLFIQNLWPNLSSTLSSHGLHLCPDVKRAIWTNLLNITGLQFEAQEVSYDPRDPKIQSFEESESLKLKVVAAEHLRNCFVGIYDSKASDACISQPQRRALERLAIARTNGITQSELAKEFGIKGNNIFYVLRNLECRGLIVRQSTIVRTKDASHEREPKNSTIVNTNMLHLYRYAKHLGCQQRLEITKEDKTLVADESTDVTAMIGDGSIAECAKEDVHVKDYLPPLKDICDKLEQADGKILVVTDIKKDLGYRGSSGHRAWRNICNRLKDARVVEEFCAKVNNKDVSCLRLLKSFSPKNFEPKTLVHGGDDLGMDQLVKLGKRGQITDQLVELPIEHQIYDMVEAKGSEGLTITEVCKRLGLNNKRYYTRLLNMFTRFGMHIQPESHNRGMAYRVWTPGNFNPEASNVVVSKTENVLSPHGTSNAPDRDLALNDKSAETILEADLWNSEVDVRGSGQSQENMIEQELPRGSAEDELRIVSVAAVSNIASPEKSPLSLPAPPRQRSYQRYPCLTLTAASARREQWILQRLQEEKFIIRAELRRELESLEKDKQTMMDRRTVDRSLNKLQQEGHCKCIRVSVPVVSNCGRSRTTDVVLQPSINLSPELLGQIYERLRSFDMEIRGQGSSRLNKGQSVPVLDSVQRILSSAKLDVQAEKSEAMRANGFVLAKMVRTKLLHIHMWGYLSGSPDWEDGLSSSKCGYDLKNPHSTCKLFAIDEAIKAMPLELFLQVVGSTQKFEDMVEKCRSGLCLSDLPEHEYRCLMDTRGTGRLSWIIDILRHLKLIRLVRDGHSEDLANAPHATLTYALELKPYIEEPVSMIMPSSGGISFDLRPQIRHDFVLSSREAVDEYWSTLEYSYSAADSRAALYSFPGSSVPEVFLSRSWASVRVMTADQRAELLKRVVNDDPNKKLSFKDCEKIAKDLNLTLEQVLRIYYDKRQQRLTRFRRVLNAGSEEIQTLQKRHGKRKMSSEGRPSRHRKVDAVDGHSRDQRLVRVSDTDCQFTEEHNFFIMGEHGDHLQTCEDEDQVDAIEEAESNEEAEHHSVIHECALSKMNSKRQRKFSWTEKAERQLVIEYIRYRAGLGAKFHRTDWSALPDLPAPPDACKRRMALLNSDLKFRKAVMKLCNMLSERYTKHLENLQNSSLKHGDCKVIVRDSLTVQPNEELGFEEQWDDFDNKNVKVALDEVLKYKRVAKLDASKRVCSVVEKWSDPNSPAEGHDLVETELDSFIDPSDGIQNHGDGNNVRPQRLRSHRLPRKYIKLLNEGMSVSRWAHDSLAVSNAAELLKLVFLSTSTAPEVPNLLANTLRRYSEHDLFTAFHYLRERKIMVGGSGGNPFGLSQHFLHSISSSPFPANTGIRAAKFASWLHEKANALMEEQIELTTDLQCGDIFHLCALVFSGELLISPCLPDEGIGEAEDSRTLKRKSDHNGLCSGDKAKKLKSSLAGEGEIISRREKGFPGIRLTVSRETMSRVDAIELFKDGNICNGTPTCSESDQVIMMSSSIESYGTTLPSDCSMEIVDERSIIPTTVTSSESEWEMMAKYAEHLTSLESNQQQASPFDPELFRAAYSVIQKAGDQGLSMEELSQIVNVKGEIFPQLLVEVLEVFRRALKVNAYKAVHVVDSLYRSKYFLTSKVTLNQELEVAISIDGKVNDEHWNDESENHKNDGPNALKDISMNADEVHKVTILNLPEEVFQPSSDMRSNNGVEGCDQVKLISLGSDHKGKTFEYPSSDYNLCRPILPWVNGDGTINKIVSKGLLRRVLGIAMQNPGILEDDIINRMNMLSPQSCRDLLKLMIMDNHIVVRKMHQSTSGEPPVLLGGLLGSSFKKSKSICREHFFANPMSTALL